MYCIGFHYQYDEYYEYYDYYFIITIIIIIMILMILIVIILYIYMYIYSIYSKYQGKYLRILDDQKSVDPLAVSTQVDCSWASCRPMSM